MRLLNIPTPVRLVRWGPDLLRDNVVHGRGDEIQDPERVIAGHCVVGSVTDGRPRDHQRIVPSWHVPDENDFVRVHVEEGYNEKCCIARAKHPHYETVAADEGDRRVLLRVLVLVAIRRVRRDEGAGILAGYITGIVVKGEGGVIYLSNGALRVRQGRERNEISVLGVGMRGSEGGEGGLALL
jgi:hypothetical protein